MENQDWFLCVCVALYEFTLQIWGSFLESPDN